MFSINIHHRNQMKTMMRYYYTPTRTVKNIYIDNDIDINI